MISFAKIVGDLFGGYVVHITGGVAAVVLASEAYRTFAAPLAQISTVLNH